MIGLWLCMICHSAGLCFYFAADCIYIVFWTGVSPIIRNGTLHTHVETEVSRTTIWPIYFIPPLFSRKGRGYDYWKIAINISKQHRSIQMLGLEQITKRSPEASIRQGHQRVATTRWGQTPASGAATSIRKAFPVVTWMAVTGSEGCFVAVTGNQSFNSISKFLFLWERSKLKWLLS